MEKKLKKVVYHYEDGSTETDYIVDPSLPKLGESVYVPMTPWIPIPQGMFLRKEDYYPRKGNLS